MKILRSLVLYLALVTVWVKADEVWVTSLGTDNTGSGTAANPYVRSSSASFDTLMNGATIPVNSTIHLMSGTYETVNGVTMKNGWKLRGAGIGVTIVKLAPNSVAWVSVIGGFFPFRTYGGRHNMEVSDLTVDCNLQNNTTAGGVHPTAVGLTGHNARISRVRVINWGSTSLYEAFLLRISSAPVDYQTPSNPTPIMTNCVIESCVIDSASTVSQPNNGVTGISIAGVSDGTSLGVASPGPGWIAGAEIKDCVVSSVSSFANGVGGPNYFNAMAGGAVYGLKITGNKFIGISNPPGVGGCVNSGCGSAINWVIENNMFLDVDKAVVFVGIDTCGEDISYVKKNIEIRNNFVALKPGGIGISLAPFCPYINGPCTQANGPTEGVVIRDNVVKGNNGAQISQAYSVIKSTGVVFENNVSQANGGQDLNIAQDAYLSVFRNNYNGAGGEMKLPDYVTPPAGADQEVTFLPTSGSGWYRLTPLHTYEYSSANVRITRAKSVSDNSRLADLEFNYAIFANLIWTTVNDPIGEIVQLQYSDSPSCVTKVRIGSRSLHTTPAYRNTLYLDVYVNISSSGTTIPITVRTRGGKNVLLAQSPMWVGTSDNPAVQEPVLNASPYRVLALGYGIRTTGPVVAGHNAIALTDADGNFQNALTESVELSSSPTAATGSVKPGNAVRLFDFFTLPSTEKFYVITGIEWKNGTGVAGSTLCGAVLVDGIPPTSSYVQAVAIGKVTANSGVNSIQRVSQISSQPIRGGATIGLFIQTDNSATQTYGTVTVASGNNRKSLAFNGGNIATQEGSSWVVSTDKAYIKVYFRGYR